MHSLLQKTIGGLRREYYLRQLFFGILLAITFFLMRQRASSEIHLSTLIIFLVNTILYPYARFTYERTIHFIVGQNIFILNALVMLLFKFITMTICWIAAIFIAPIGVAYLYYLHRTRKTQ